MSEVLYVTWMNGSMTRYACRQSSVSDGNLWITWELDSAPVNDSDDGREKHGKLRPVQVVIPLVNVRSIKEYEPLAIEEEEEEAPPVADQDVKVDFSVHVHTEDEFASLADDANAAYLRLHLKREHAFTATDGDMSHGRRAHELFHDEM